MLTTLVLYNLRSTYNVGAILRTADAVGLQHVIAIGTTPYPEIPGDLRPPHVRESNTRSIAKAALGAERTIAITYYTDIKKCLSFLQNDGQELIFLEQSSRSISLFDYVAPKKPFALVVGPEVTGFSDEELSYAQTILEIPMIGQKESLNVSVAASLALYALGSLGSSSGFSKPSG